MRRPSHRRNDRGWCPGPRSAWAQARGGKLYARRLPLSCQPEFLAIYRKIEAAHMRMLYAMGEVESFEQGKVIVYRGSR